MPPFESNLVSADYDVLAPDGSEIRLLHSLEGASVVHCALPVGAVSIPVRHRTVEEVWFFLAGQGQVWRKQGEREEVLDVKPGRQLDDSAGHAVSVSHYRQRSAGIPDHATTPPWPGEDEAVVAREGRWEPTVF